MPNVDSAKIEVTVDMAKLRERLGEARPSVMERVRAQVDARQKLWHRKCLCSCKCAIMHPGRKDTCVLCQDGDHWVSLASYLDKIEARLEGRS